MFCVDFKNLLEITRETAWSSETYYTMQTVCVAHQFQTGAFRGRTFTIRRVFEVVDLRIRADPVGIAVFTSVFRVR